MKHWLLVIPVMLAMPALAQQPAPIQAPVLDPRLQAAQKAFELLPEAERRAIQQDLGFTTSFSGAAQGSFGSLTFNAIQIFERSNGLIVDGILTPPERQALAASASKARLALRFAPINDPRSGVTLGLPQSIFLQSIANAVGGSRWQTPDGKATLETTSLVAGGETLQQLFERTTQANTPGRKITYKLLRPDFFVVAGETPTGKFYRRIALGPSGTNQQGGMRGFSLGYDKTLAADMDRLVITITNSFEPFPLAVAAIPLAPKAAIQERLGSALILDGATLLAAEIMVSDCKSLMVGPDKRPAQLRLSDSQAGLALLTIKAAGKAMELPKPAQPLALGSAPQASRSLVVLAQAWSGNTPAGVYSEAKLVDSSRILAPLQPGGSGAALFDESGHLVGLVLDDPGARKQIAGVVPQARYRFASAEMIGGFLQKNGVPFIKPETGKPLDADKAFANVAAARAKSVIALICEF